MRRRQGALCSGYVAPAQHRPAMTVGSSEPSGRETCDYGAWSTGGSGEAEGADMAGFGRGELRLGLACATTRPDGFE